MLTANFNRDKHRSPLHKFDSAVVLERLESNASSTCTFLRQNTGPQSANESDRGNAATLERGEAAQTPVGLDVSIRFGRLSLVMALSLSAIVALTATFNHGVVLGHFDPSDKDDDATKRLLDDYNSYTGNVASLFGRPIEIFVALAVHLLILRVLAASLLRTEISWKMDALTLVLSAGVGYLMSNGLNALNVQPQNLTIKPTISALDIKFVSTLSASASAKTTTLDQSYSERQERNPIANTVLRSLVLPRVPVKKAYCKWDSNIEVLGNQDFPDLVLEYGFSQHDWQSRLLPEAIEPKQLRMVVNPTNKSANDHVRPQDLPMNASLAADLLLPWLDTVTSIFPGDFKLDDDEVHADPKQSWARLNGLLPPAVPAQEEMEQRDWLLRETSFMLTQFFNDTPNTTRSDIVMEFSRVDISPTIRFDAITIDIEFDPAILAEVIDKENGGTRYNNVHPEYQCGPWTAKCMMPRPHFVDMKKDKYYDPPAHVRVVGSCVNSHGSEELVLDLADKGVECPQISNTSMMVMSIGKRFIADSITQRQSSNDSNVSTSTVVKNLRRVYSFTMAKLSWELSDLAVEFNAKCHENVGSCKGLRIPLTSTGPDSPQQQELIVGVEALPMDVLEPPNTHRPNFVPLVLLHEPPPIPNGKFDRWETRDEYNSLSGDPLLMHNIGKISWLMEQPHPNETTCNAYFEDRLQFILNNHMYIEQGLQTAYTAATFFLFQNGVVKDVVKMNATENTLNFQLNLQSVELLASIPDQNARLTIGGCAVLALCLCAVIVWAWVTSTTATEDRTGGLGHVRTPHVVARVMLDSVHFPPLFLQSRVTGVNSAMEDDKQPHLSVDDFAIDRLTLQPVRKENDMV